MVSSMTGFGRAELAEESRKITIELKSVNHKYMDLNIRGPRKFNCFEQGIRNAVKKTVSRGKIDVFITYEDIGAQSEELRYNAALAGQYFACLKQIKEDFRVIDDISAVSIARLPDVLVAGEAAVDEDEMWLFISRALDAALAAFKESRVNEGEALKKDILVKLSEMEDHVAFVEERVPVIVAEFREKLGARVRELVEESLVDEGRIASEVVMYADRIAVDEELVRLGTHIKHMREVLENGNEIGRNMDFIAQEMNREANTILSKSSDIEITNRGIELKTCIEKIREQVQNIE